jgi:hypothetical protein
VFVGRLLADGGDLGAHFKYNPLDAAPGRKTTTRHAPRRRLNNAVSVTPA